jgi:CDP-glycerol glycerophosphotransferase
MPKPSEEQQLLDLLYQESFAIDLEGLSQKSVKRPLILFFGRPTFSDNTKYLYLATVRANPGAEVRWCSWNKELLATLASRGLPVFDLGADVAKTLATLMDASVAVFCENPNSAFGGNRIFLGAIAGARKVQLWHGISVKHLDLMLTPFLDLRDRGFRNAIRMAVEVDAFLSTSSSLDAFWVRAFGASRLVRAGQPRNEVIVREPTELEWIGAELPPDQAMLLQSGTRTRLLVVPTWQRGEEMFISSPAFYQRLAEWAKANRAVAFVKSHPFLQERERPADIPGLVYHLHGGTDIYPWMSKFDALITDYSSIMFDFLLTNKPVLTYDTRTQVSYGFEPDWSLVPDVPFRYAFSQASFETVLARALTDHPMAASQRAMIARLYETPSIEANQRLVQFLHDESATVVARPYDVVHPQERRGLALSA